MNISDTEGFIKVASCRLSENSKLFFDYSVCKDKSLLDLKFGRVYLICVNDEIYKIGYSKQLCGIKGTFSFYKYGMSGSPSLRSFGIYYLINNELDKGNKVDMYVKFSEPLYYDVPTLTGNKVKRLISPGQEFEFICKQDYFNKKGSYPIWNFKENKQSFPKDIKKLYSEYIQSKVEKC